MGIAYQEKIYNFRRRISSWAMSIKIHQEKSISHEVPNLNPH